MGFRSALIKPFAKKIAKDITRWSSQPIQAQEKVFQTLISQGKRTKFGADQDFSNIKNYEDFKSRVPVKDYEGIRHYVELIKQGKKDILWPGKPMYFAKTSGTTSGVKYIPLTKSSLPNHFGTARNALFNYYARTGIGNWLDGKMIFLSGSPELEKVGGINTGRLSGIVNHQVPGWLRTNQLPSYETNCIDDWEDKLNHIVEETYDQDMRLISGIPPWVQMYYERLLEKTGKANIKSLFPNFNIFVFGGVNFEPYRDSLEELLGGQIPILETYPASEGFIAFQDNQESKGLLLNVASGIFFEFIPVDEYFNENPTRLALAEIDLATNEFNVTIKALSSSAGLAFLDAYALTNEVAENGYSSDGFTVTTDFLGGGLFSLDGFHLTARGNAIIANEMMKVIDFTYDSNFEEAGALNNIGDYPTIYSIALQ